MLLQKVLSEGAVPQRKGENARIGMGLDSALFYNSNDSKENRITYTFLYCPILNAELFKSSAEQFFELLHCENFDTEAFTKTFWSVTLRKELIHCEKFDTEAFTKTLIIVTLRKELMQESHIQKLETWE